MKRLTPATLTFGVMAIMGLLVSAYVVRSLLAREVATPAPAVRNMPVPVVDLPAGTEITDKHLGLAPTLISTLTPDMLANKSVVVGRVVKEPLKKAVPIKANQLYAPGERPPLKLAKGMKALTISLNSATAIVDGLIKPGDYCDIQFTVNTSWAQADNRLPYGYQLTLFKGIKVLAINRNVTQQAPDNSGNTVTLEVSPGQANAILLAQGNGTLNLTYTPVPTKGGVIVSDLDTDRLTLEKLLNLPPKEAPPSPPKPPEPYFIDQYRHLRRSTVGYLPNGRILDAWDYSGYYNQFGFTSGVPGSNYNPNPNPQPGTNYGPNPNNGVAPNGPTTPNATPAPNAAQPSPVTPAQPSVPGPSASLSPNLPFGQQVPTASVGTVPYYGR